MSTPLKAPPPTRNTPKSGYSGQGDVTPPGAFKVIKMNLISSTGISKDIRNLVESFTITSELFSPVVTFSATIRDNQNLFEPVNGEAFKICGQENIEIEIDVLDPVIDGAPTIKHTFSVKEYPTLTRTLDFPDVQIYTVLAISDFAYRSSLMKICRPLFQGQPLEKNIESIFKDDLGLTEFKVYGTVENNFDGIINIQRPLQAAEWLRSRSFHGNSPFFLHSDTTKSGEIFMSSWTQLSLGPLRAKFTFRPFSTKEPGTRKHTLEERSKILSMTSSIKLDRLKSANSGAYASRYNITDFTAKSFYISDFISATPDAENDWIPRKYKITKRDGTVASEPMNNIPSSAIVSAHTNSSSLGGGLDYNSITSSTDKLPYARALQARLNESTHEIVVYGRFSMQAGSKIELKVMKTKVGNDKAVTSEPDPLASGKYIILVSSSIFSEGIYTNKLKLAKLVPGLIGEIMEPTGAMTANKSGIEGITSITNPPPSADANNDGTISDSERDNYVKSLGNTTRGGTGVKITSYGQANDSTGDSNTQAQRGFANNLLREGSVALSPDIYNQYKPAIGSAVYVNGQHVGYYEDRTPAGYNGQNFGQTIDVYDPNNRLGPVLKNAGDAQLTFGPARPQISNP